MKNAICILSTLLPTFGFAANETSNETNEQRPNVLFIVVDDLRTELSCYGESQIHSPNIDKFSQQSFLFERAYCNIPVSGASRASLFTGMRSHQNTFLTAASWIDKDAKEAITLPETLREAGYHTISFSKVFHHETDRTEAWNERYRHVDNSTPDRWKNYMEYKPTGKKDELTPAYECADVQDSAYIDGQTANEVIDCLRKLKTQNKPFFLGVGFLKPHLPFNAPKKYWDMYEEKSIQLPSNYTDYFPTIPKCAFHNSGELRTYAGIPNERVFDKDLARTLIHGYYACVSYIDAQVGRVLDELARLEMDRNTLVVILGDNGWNLGEHAMWNKHCNFSTSTKVPLMIKIPNLNGARVKSIVEYVDLYPTICEHCNVQVPKDQLQGTSLIPVIETPDKVVKSFAISKFKNAITLIKPQFTYTEWFSVDGKVLNRMLFDIDKDPNENENIAQNPENQDLVQQLSQELLKNRGY